ncbi:MAG: class I SAM-dependent methyltransferase [Alphaproteobacteria bacterium]|nr:class I SAM-dependent methyltransferase [Alphaproteobacteria bacterium]
MRWRDLLGLRRPGPKLIKRIRARAYPFTPSPRPYATSLAGQALIRILDRNRAGYERLCGEIVGNRAFLQDVPRKAEKADPAPHWVNGYLPPLDAMSLYTFLRMLKPRTYLEIGSGNSTKIARKAIRDHGLPTRIVSIDPNPRAEVDALCDEVIRKPFQDVGQDALNWLRPGDVLFQDGSHHLFTNSDATVFYTELLPVLPAGITYGVHDIFLPGDYPEIWHKRFYNEQYLLASFLLAGAGGDEIVFPCKYIAEDAALAASLAGIFDPPALAGLRPHGGAFWMRRQAVSDATRPHSSGGRPL